MKVTTLTTLAILLSSGYALAGAGAPVPDRPEGGPPSGRPSAVLDDAKCESVWQLTEREGDNLSEHKAAPYVVNFQMVDANDDGKISEDEFKAGCGKGWIQEHASLPVDSGGGQTPQNPTKE